MQKLSLIIYFLPFFVFKSVYSQKPRVQNQNDTLYNSWVIKSKPQFTYISTTELENFECYKNILFWVSIKITSDKNGNIIVAGLDKSKRQIHLLIKSPNSNVVRNYYTWNPYFDSLDQAPKLMNLYLTGDSNKFFIAIDYKFLVFLEIKSGKLIITKHYSLNNPNLRPYNNYYYFKNLYGIYPLSELRINKKYYSFSDSFSIDKLDRVFKKNIFYQPDFNPEFWNLGMSSYISGLNNRLILANALKNEIKVFDIDNANAITIKNAIPDFKVINKVYFDSIYRKYNGRNISFRLGEFLDQVDSFNYIFKIILNSENEIWVMWQGYDEKPKQLKLDIIVFDTKTKSWQTKYHRLVYDYLNMGQSEIVTETNYPIELFNNLTYVKDNKLFVITSDNMDFDPIGKTFKEVKELIVKNSKPKSLKLYEFEIKYPEVK